MARNIGYEFSDDNLCIAGIERRLGRILMPGAGGLTCSRAA